MKSLKKGTTQFGANVNLNKKECIWAIPPLV
jgi:hypothetical protein